MDWQPQDQPLRELACCLRDSLNGQDRNVQKRAELMLIQATSNPDFVNYLTYIFCTPQVPPMTGLDQQTYDMVRFAAALNLKTKIHVAYNTVSPESLENVRRATLLGLRDPTHQIRNSAGSLITEILQQGGLLAWPQVLQELITLVANLPGDVPQVTQEAAMSALSKVCEDNRKLLDKDYGGQRPLEVIIPRLLEFTGSQSASVRSMALNTLQAFLAIKPKALIDNFDNFMSSLFRLANDPSTDVRRIVCQAFVQLADVAAEQLIPHIGGLVDYIIMQQNNGEDPELALDAAEFWLTAAETPALHQPLAPHMPKIVPLLLQSMVYDEDDAIRLAGEEDDADLEDRAEDLKPQFARAKGARVEAASDTAATGKAEQADDDELSEGEIDDDSDWGDPEEEWSVRKCSAAALDVFATVYHESIFDLILPYLKETLRHENWANREAAVLTLGAIAGGCMEAVTPHLPELIPYLISLLNDPQPVVRTITCWCLGRYSGWAAHLEDPAAKAQYFEPMIDGLLQRMLDRNKKVQEAAVSAFTSLEDKADTNLIPYVEPILRRFVECFARYKERNMAILYDAVQTLANSVQAELAKPEMVNILMPALIDRYNKVPDDNQEMYPMLECLGYVATAYGEAFTPFAPPMFQRCIKLIYQTLQEAINAAQNPDATEPDRDFMITSLDLLSAIIQSISPAKSGELVANAQPPFFDLLCYCMNDSNDEVRQSSYALLGDCATYLFPHLQPYLPTILPILLKQLDLDSIRDEYTGFALVSNACWSLGEISLHEGADLSPYLDQLFVALVTILSNENVSGSLNENAALALGRLGIFNSERLAPHLHQYADGFLKSLSRIDFDREKASAFLGFNRVVMRNPQALESCLVMYFQTIASLPQKTLSTEKYRDVQESFQQVLQGYKKLIPNFDSFLLQLPPAVTQKLQSHYQI
ncbi:hypothetical protein VTN49DRAFT_2701 [Thermomyces lanuginosus]|uniref:uncharacterized protein n=1 Tax=Thermomyces lanuginosus TaxID=5541 RepID=UPI003742908F